MAIMVKCVHCGKQFDRELIPCVKKGRRYAHLECENKISRGEKVENTDSRADQIDFHDFINDLFNKKCNWPLIQQQERKYLQEGMTYSGMKKTLYWWYHIQGHSTSQSNGSIGIIPYAYKQAEQYYYKLYTVNESNKDKEKTEIKTIEVKVKEPQVVLRQTKFFNIGE